MSETPQRLPYEPLDERQRAIDLVRNLEVTKDGDVFDLIARLLRDKDRLDWIDDQISNGATVKFSWWRDEDEEEGNTITLDGWGGEHRKYSQFLTGLDRLIDEAREEWGI